MKIKRENTIEKYHLNLAGEYRACAELLRRGIFATVTFGNMKGADVIAVGSNRRAAVVEVKASSSNRFVTGYYQKYKTREQEHPSFWVLASMPSDSNVAERFFVLTHQELGDVQARRNHGNRRYSHEACAKRYKAGVDNLLIDHVINFENQWDTIVRWCNQSI